MINKRRELLSTLVIDNLQKRNIDATYVKTKEEAKDLLLSLIEKNSSIAFGGSKSVLDTGIIEELQKDSSYELFLRRKDVDVAEQERIIRQAFFADYYLCSANAISEDGIIVNIDGSANRVAAISYGPKKVIMLVGMNKIVKNEEDALSRARNVAAPINAQRFGLSTPCSITGSCHNCMSKETICCQFLTTRFSRIDHRIHVVLVEEDLGF